MPRCHTPLCRNGATDDMSANFLGAFFVPHTASDEDVTNAADSIRDECLMGAHEVDIDVTRMARLARDAYVGRGWQRIDRTLVRHNERYHVLTDRDIARRLHAEIRDGSFYVHRNPRGFCDGWDPDGPRHRMAASEMSRRLLLPKDDIVAEIGVYCDTDGTVHLDCKRWYESWPTVLSRCFSDYVSRRESDALDCGAHDEDLVARKAMLSSFARACERHATDDVVCVTFVGGV